jgi:hypothetical protein
MRTDKGRASHGPALLSEVTLILVDTLPKEKLMGLGEKISIWLGYEMF